MFVVLNGSLKPFIFQTTLIGLLFFLLQSRHYLSMLCGLSHCYFGFGLHQELVLTVTLLLQFLCSTLLLRHSLLLLLLLKLLILASDFFGVFLPQLLVLPAFLLLLFGLFLFESKLLLFFIFHSLSELFELV